MSYHLNSVGQTVYPNNAPQIPNNQPGAQIVGQKMSTAQNQLAANAAYGNQLLPSQNGQILSSKGTLNNYNNANQGSQQHRINQVNGQFVAQNLSGIAGTNIGINETDLSPALIGDGNFQKQLLNSRQNQIVMSNGQSNGYHVATDNQIQQYQQLEQKLLQKHHEKQQKGHDRRSQKNIQLLSDSQQQGVIEGPGRRGDLRGPNKDNIGTNYQLPGINPTVADPNASALTANSTSMLFQTPQVRPGSRKMNFNQMSQPKQDQNTQQQYNQLQHLQQMTEYHQNKKQRHERPHNQKGSYVQKGQSCHPQQSIQTGTLSSKNIQFNQIQQKHDGPRMVNQNYRGGAFSSQNRATINTIDADPSLTPLLKKHGLTSLNQPPEQQNSGQINLQQQILDNYNNQLNDNLSVYNSNPQQQYAQSGQSQQEQRNKDSRNSKRSVVFSKKPTQEQQKAQQQKPNTPKMNGNTHISKSNQRINNTDQIAQSQQFANGQTQQALTSTGTTKIRVNAPNTVKINKSTIKNLVMQKQQQQLADMQIHLSNDDQIVFQQQNQSKALINQKRRSNAVDQHNRIDSGMMIGAKSITSQSTMKNHAGRMAKKVTSSNLNVNSQQVQMSDQQIYQQQHNMLFNKTMGQQLGQMLIQTPQAVNPSAAVNPQNLQVANAQFKKAHSIVTPVLQTSDPKNPQNLANNLLVVKMNTQIPGIKLGQQSDTSPTRGVNPHMNPMTQFQVQNLASLSPEQQQSFLHQQQLLMHQQQMLQQQQQEASVAAQIQLVSGPTQQQLQTDSQQQSSSRSKIEMNQGHLRPQSQNNRIVQGLNQSNNFQNQMNMSQHSGSNDGGFTKNSGSGQMAQKQLNLKNLSNGDFLSQQNLGSQQRYLVLQNPNHPPNSTQNQNTVNATVNLQNQSPNNQNKILSSKHLQIQQIRMVNNSSVDNYNANNSDNGSQRQIQTHAQLQTGTLQPQQQAGGSPGNSKYFLKNQLRNIEPEDGHDSDHRRMQGGPNGGMTLEDDVESMLSDQFNTSNESMFRVRGVVAGTTVGFMGGAGGGGDSTFRCNDSMYDEDRGLISESEDGWQPEKAGDQKNEDRFDDISEHTSDECTDSDQELVEGQEKKPKVKKAKGEKGEKRRKKKRRLEAEQQEQANKEQKELATEAKKMVQTYKKLEGDSKETKKTQKEVKPQKQVEESKAVKSKKGNENAKAAQIKINIQTKKNDKVQDPKSTKNNFNSPEPRGKNQAKNDQNNKQNTNQQANNKPKKEDKKEELKVEDKNKENAAVAHTPLKKAKKNGLKLQALNHALPKNLQECHERFFESGFKINPQFEYENAQFAQKFLEQFDEPDGEFLPIAKEILASFLKEYGSESNYLDAEGKKLDQEETHKAITTYLENLGVQEWISINFQKNQVAPTSVTHDPKTGKCKMNIKLPCEYREGRMMGVLDHEIGTHFLRKHNEKLQQWYKKREKFEMRTCIATEEGLACTNQMVQTVKDGKCKPFLYRSALNYYAAYMAKEMSFVDLFRDLERYVDNPQARWKFVLRVKRGLTDTSQKGGLFKDQVYLEGAVKVLSRRKSLNFTALLCGKISLVDLDREAIYSILNYEGQLLPPFMADMDEYMHCLDVIAETNHIVDEEWNPVARPLSIEQKDNDVEEQDNINSSPTHINQETVEQHEAPDEIHQNGGEPAAQPIQEDVTPVENATITADPMPEIPLFQEQVVEAPERQASLNIDQIMSDVQTTDPPQIKVDEVDNNPTPQQETTGTS